MNTSTDVTEDSLLIGGGEPRRRGRPRAPEPRSSVSTWLWARHHDALVKRANERGISVSALVRGILSKAVPIDTST